jgi:uncharacterized protein (DUF1330 family)
MSAFLLIDTKINDHEAYEKYKTVARPIAEKFGGQYRTRGGEMDVIQTELWSPTRIVLIEFPSMESARNFINCDEYAPVRKIREGASECTLMLLEGL